MIILIIILLILSIYLGFKVLLYSVSIKGITLYIVDKYNELPNDAELKRSITVAAKKTLSDFFKVKRCIKKTREQGNFNPDTGERIGEYCKYCWVLKKDKYNCGYYKCPGYKLYKELINNQ